LGHEFTIEKEWAEQKPNNQRTSGAQRGYMETRVMAAINNSIESDGHILPY